MTHKHREHDPPDDYVDIEILPVKYGKVCASCARLLKLSKFEHAITPERARALGFTAQHKVRQDWRECRECTKARGAAPKPPHKLTRAEIIRETDKGRLPERKLHQHIQAAEHRARVAQAFGSGERHSREWAKPFEHARDLVTAEMHRVRMLRQYNDRPDKYAPSVVTFCDAYLLTLEALRGHLFVAKRHEQGRMHRRNIKYQAQRKSEHYLTNPNAMRPRGRKPTKILPAPAWGTVCLPESRWRDYLPEGELERLRLLHEDVPLRLRAQRMRVIPLLLDPEREHPLMDFTTLDDDARDRQAQLASQLRTPANPPGERHA